MSNTTMQLANRLWVFTYSNYQCGEFEHNPIQRGHAMHMEQPKHRLLTLCLAKDMFLPIIWCYLLYFSYRIAGIFTG